MKTKKQACCSLGKKIAALRHHHHITQEDLAVSFDDHREHISRIERGLVDVRLSSIIKIAEALDVDIAQLFDDDK